MCLGESQWRCFEIMCRKLCSRSQRVADCCSLSSACSRDLDTATTMKHHPVDEAVSKRTRYRIQTTVSRTCKSLDEVVADCCRVRNGIDERRRPMKRQSDERMSQNDSHILQLVTINYKVIQSIYTVVSSSWLSTS